MAAQHFIGNRRIHSHSSLVIPVIDPSDGQPYAEIARGDAYDVDFAVQTARTAADGEWGLMPAAERGRQLARLAQAIGRYQEELAQIEARDCGKPLGQARTDAAAVARYFEFYAGACDKLHGDTLPYQHGYTVFTLREAFGVTGHIIPWNYPLQIFGRSVGAALAAGNACV
ncbi:MAG: aldehyde dehydrogenase family protein, partial [Burkholderiaceae bacterium]